LISQHTIYKRVVDDSARAALSHRSTGLSPDGRRSGYDRRRWFALARLDGRCVVVTFLIVTPVAGTLLGFNWTQAVLLGGFAGSVAVASAWLTARRGAGDA